MEAIPKEIDPWWDIIALWVDPIRLEKSQKIKYDQHRICFQRFLGNQERLKWTQSWGKPWTKKQFPIVR